MEDVCRVSVKGKDLYLAGESFPVTIFFMLQLMHFYVGGYAFKIAEKGLKSGSLKTFFKVVKNSERFYN